MTVTKAVSSASLSNSSSGNGNTSITHHYQWQIQRCWRPISLPIPKPNSQNFTIATVNRSLLIPRVTGPSSEPTNNGVCSKKTKTKNKTIGSASAEEKNVNPVGLGRRSRQHFDEVWHKFFGLGQISRTSLPDKGDALNTQLIREGPINFLFTMCEFVIPGDQNTTVLVVRATSIIGRIVVRKLMVRAYTVKALVRNADQEVVELLPRSVEIVTGDVGDPATLYAAVQGCNKIIYCATARSTVSGDLYRVDQRGVYNLTNAFQDYNNKMAQLRAGKSSKSKLTIVKFKTPESVDGWEVRQGTYFQDVVASKYDGGMDAKFEFTFIGDAVFSGYVFTRGGYVELSKKLSLPLGLVLSTGGNGRSYILILEAGPSADTSQSKLYFSRFNTKAGYCRVRVPFSSFRPVKPDDPPLDPSLVHTLTIRFEPRRQKAVEVSTGVKQQDPRSFTLLLEYIKALPTGQETDFILVSCTGSGAGEESLRKSGKNQVDKFIQEEPGGQCALKALHDSTTRNKSFDVCYEYIADQGKELYELIDAFPHHPPLVRIYMQPETSSLQGYVLPESPPNILKTLRLYTTLVTKIFHCTTALQCSGLYMCWCHNSSCEA
ncbi:hypothetical protein D8674_019095 [Pyrus ussuriensis x Pyrus communis]|uniref:Uncharacterized protein n=1 Tax=Pyrus ussuriensis x Pyrus communis TaxID=2448454 RepID=A0A5N5G6T5_9ROSA|nr:hypothetical protein D8674_019095 [Pyrus ussuriensis x Pyrus communis]